MEEKESATFKDAVKTIKLAILEGQYYAAKGVNHVQLAVYYGIGRYLSIRTKQQKWGMMVLSKISEQLRKELPGLRGFSVTQMKDMRRFYEEWKQLDASRAVATAQMSAADRAVATARIEVASPIYVGDIENFPLESFFKVPFTHHTIIINRLKTLQERYYYIQRCAEEHLSAETLKRLIKEDSFHTQSSLPNNFSETIDDTIMARRAVMAFKDEYLLNFINVEEIGECDKEDVDERVFEHKIINNIKNFIMTFGHDFAFIGNQYHLEAYSEDFFPDLLFFNRELNALVVVELKTGKFKPSYLGQLTTYLRILDDKVRKAHENPSVGIVLCKEANRHLVEYVIQDYDKPMGVATYKTSGDMPQKLREALPDENELLKLLEPESEEQ